MFTLPELPYNYKALEPNIDAQTMEIHHSKHHQAYVDNANKILQIIPEMENNTNDDVVKIIKFAFENKNIGLFNNAAQHSNHTFFWKCMKPNGGGEPSVDLLNLINRDFESLDKMMVKFKETALAQFGSGWAWLVYNTDNKKLEIMKTPNGETPIINDNLKPILALDVWEHAYYLKYQNKRADYVDAFFKVVDWEFAQKNLEKAKS
jgi:Fe-Mn family superoxide dismutase